MSARTLRGSNGSNDSEAGCVSPKKGGKRRVSPSRITRKRRRNLMKHGRKMDVEASDIDVIGATSDVNDGEDTPKGVQLERGLSFLSSLTSLWKSKPNVSSTNNDAYQHRSKSFSGRLCSPNSLSEQHSGEHDYNGRVGLKKRRTESRAEPVPIEAENLLAETPRIHDCELRDSDDRLSSDEFGSSDESGSEDVLIASSPRNRGTSQHDSVRQKLRVMPSIPSIDSEAAEDCISEELMLGDDSSLSMADLGSIAREVDDQSTPSSEMPTRTPKNSKQGIFSSLMLLFARGVGGQGKDSERSSAEDTKILATGHTPSVHRSQGIDLDARQPPANWRERVPDYEYNYEEEIADSTSDFDPFLFIRGLQLSGQCETPYCFDYVPRPPPATSSKPTLVLDLDETLVHCTTGPMPRCDFKFPIIFGNVPLEVRVRQRPYLQYFLQEMVKHFELIVFTASQEVYASKLLDIIDPHRYISHRLYRDSCRVTMENYLKDLSVLDRNLSRTVILDNSITAYSFQINNGIPVASWYDDDDDVQLLSLIPFLESVSKLNNVRPFLDEKFKLQRLVSASELVYPNLLAGTSHEGEQSFDDSKTTTKRNREDESGDSEDQMAGQGCLVYSFESESSGDNATEKKRRRVSFRVDENLSVRLEASEEENQDIDSDSDLFEDALAYISSDSDFFSLE